MTDSMEQRQTIFTDLRSLSDALDATPTNGVSNLANGVKSTAVYCDGSMLMLLWEYDATQDTSFQAHSHTDTTEHIGVAQGVFRCIVEGAEKVIESPGQHIHIPPGHHHQIICRKDDGPSRGWAIMVLPGDQLVPKEKMLSKGTCWPSPEGAERTRVSV